MKQSGSFAAWQFGILATWHMGACHFYFIKEVAYSFDIERKNSVSLFFFLCLLIQRRRTRFYNDERVFLFSMVFHYNDFSFVTERSRLLFYCDEVVFFFR